MWIWKVRSTVSDMCPEWCWDSWSGRIISLASVVGLHGNAGQDQLRSLKKQESSVLTKSAAKELASRGIHRKRHWPWDLLKQIWQTCFLDKVKENIAASIPIGKMGTTEDVAKAAAFLASDGASLYHRTGAQCRRRNGKCRGELRMKRRVVVTGLGAVTPIGNDVESFKRSKRRKSDPGRSPSSLIQQDIRRTLGSGAEGFCGKRPYGPENS